MIKAILYFTHLLLYLYYYNIAQGTGSCTRSPIITSYSRPYEASASTYNLTWQSAACNSASVTQYRIQVAGDCTTGSTQPLTILTGNTKTTALLIIPSCNMNCYLRIRAEMSDSSYTDYSSCVIIDNHLMEHHRELMEYDEPVCVPIRGACSFGFHPTLYINSHPTQWPQPGETLYNITYSMSSGSLSFCFLNITEDTVLTEVCHYTHSAGCSLCSVDSGEIEFLSYSEISTFLPTVQTDTGISHSNLSNRTTVTVTIPWNMHPGLSNITENNLALFTIVGTVSTVLLCSLIVMGIIIALMCYKGVEISPCSSNSNTGNTHYEEPSLPDPIYQELEDTKKPDATMEMVRNNSYGRIHKIGSGKVSVLN